MRLTKEIKSRLIKAIDREAQWHLTEAKRLQRLGSIIGPWRESGAASGYHEVERYLEKARYLTEKGLAALTNKGSERIEYSMSDKDEESKAYNIAMAFAIDDAIIILRAEMENG